MAMNKLNNENAVDYTFDLPQPYPMYLPSTEHIWGNNNNINGDNTLMSKHFIDFQKNNDLFLNQQEQQFSAFLEPKRNDNTITQTFNVTNSFPVLSHNNNLSMANNNVLLNGHFGHFPLGHPSNLTFDQQSYLMLLKNSNNLPYQSLISNNPLNQPLYQSNQILQNNIITEKVSPKSNNLSNINLNLTTNNKITSSVCEQERDSGNETQNSTSPPDLTSMLPCSSRYICLNN